MLEALGMLTVGVFWVGVPIFVFINLMMAFAKWRKREQNGK